MTSNAFSNRCSFYAAAALFVGLTAVASPAAAEGDGDALATYNGNTYTVGEFNEAVERLNPRARKSLEDADRRKQFLENQILSTLIYESGVASGVDKDPEVARQLAEYERHIVIQRVMQESQAATVEDSEVQAYYDENPQEFTSDRTKASHILVAEEELARDLHKQITEDPSKFEDLAKEHSTDRSNSKRGGDLGFFGRGRMVAEFEEAAFALTEDGQVSEPIKTRFGWHIIKRTGREDGNKKTFDEVKNQIRVRMVNQRRRERTEEFLAKLKSDASLKIDEKRLAEVPLPAKGEDEGAAQAPAGHGGH